MSGTLNLHTGHATALQSEINKYMQDHCPGSRTFIIVLPSVSTELVGGQVGIRDTEKVPESLEEGFRSAVALEATGFGDEAMECG